MHSFLPRVALLAAFVFLVLTIGCGGGGGTDSPPASTTVTGRVVAANTTSGLAGAQVSLGGVTGYTDAQGRFSLSGDLQGYQQITVTANGYSLPDGTLYVTVAGGTKDLGTILLVPTSLTPPNLPTI